MSGNEAVSRAEAMDALRTAEQARARANACAATPGWWSWLGALTNGSGLAVTTGPWALGPQGSAPVLLTGLALLGVFPALCVRRAGRVRVVAWPPGPIRRRLAVESVPLAAYAAALVVAFTIGWPQGALTAGVLGGAALWWRLDRRNRMIAGSA